MKKIGLGILITVVALALSGIAVAIPEQAANVAKEKASEQSNYSAFKPVPARDVEIVKKATIRGKPPWAGGPGGPNGEEAGVATGILGEEVEGTRYAIVIGISDYPGENHDLKYADDDASSTVLVLKNKYSFLEGNIYSFIDVEGGGAKNATAEAIYDAVTKLKSTVTSTDEVVFFFSGHGGRGRASDGDDEKWDESIVVHDGGNNLVHLWDGQLKIWFKGFATSRIIFIFDSCVAGGMNDVAAEGRVINMATKERGQDTAVELSSLGYGEFTYYFVVRGMGGLADTTPKDEKVTVEEAFDYAKANCNYDHPTIDDRFTNDLLL